jgi:hypothetical protein
MNPLLAKAIHFMAIGKIKTGSNLLIKFIDKEAKNEISSSIIRNPLFKEAIRSIKNNEIERGTILLAKLISMGYAETKNIDAKSRLERKKIMSAFGFTAIYADEEIPEGYERCSFTEPTILELQQKNKPSWGDITTEIWHDRKLVFEDQYSMQFASESELIKIATEHKGHFSGRINTGGSVEDTIEKFKKNVLYLLVQSLQVTIYANWNVRELLEKLLDLDNLHEVYVTQGSIQYDLKNIKKFFTKKQSGLY